MLIRTGCFLFISLPTVLHHSTETALVHLYNEMVFAIDNEEVSTLALLDMSAAFKTIDHDITLEILRRRFNVQDATLDWFASYFTNRSLVVVSNAESSSVRQLEVGTPQASVLRSRSSIIYAEYVTDFLPRYRVCHHIFLDDM
jgi:Reverse transcriptase (RNA-dependent DNA polymerase)